MIRRRQSRPHKLRQPSSKSMLQEHRRLNNVLLPVEMWETWSPWMAKWYLTHILSTTSLQGMRIGSNSFYLQLTCLTVNLKTAWVLVMVHRICLTIATFASNTLYRDMARHKRTNFAHFAKFRILWQNLNIQVSQRIHHPRSMQFLRLSPTNCMSFSLMLDTVRWMYGSLNASRIFFERLDHPTFYIMYSF